MVLNNFYYKNYIADNETSLTHTIGQSQIKDFPEFYTWAINKCKKNNINEKFIEDLYQYSVTLIIGNFLRSDESIKNKKIMFDIIRNYLVLNKNIPLKLPLCGEFFTNFSY